MCQSPLHRRGLLLVAVLSGVAWALSRGVDAGERVTRPNILVAIADDWSAGHAGAYGCAWVKTPAFDRVARDGLLFTNAYTPDAKCAPSRSCILTGRNPWQLKAAANHVPFFPAEFKAYPEALAEQGYFVGMTGKGWAPGIAKDAEGKPRAMAGKPFSKRTAPPPTGDISGNDYASNLNDFLDATPKDTPWCFWYGSTEPHRGYAYGSGVRLGGKKTTDLDRVPGYWPDNETVRNDMLDYAFEVEHFDRHLGRMLESLEQRGLLENTLVVVTSDNGMPFPRSKGQTYRISNRMPLAVMWKKGIANPGRTVDDFVSFIDFAPTFIDVAGVEWAATGMQAAAGRSLKNIFQSEQAGRIDPARDHVLLGRERNDVGRPHDQGYPVRAILQNECLYLRNFEPSRWPSCNPETGYLDTDGSPTKTEVLKTRTVADQRTFWALSFGKRGGEELYDLKKDPDCLNNLSAQADCQERKAQLEKQLMDLLRAQEDPRVLGQGSVFDNYPYSNEAQRGFYERFIRGEKVKAGWVNDSDFEREKLE